MTSNTLDTRVAVKALREALTLVRAAVLDRFKDPLIITAADGTMTVRARNGSVAAEATLHAECAAPGAAQVDSQLLASVLAAASFEAVRLECMPGGALRISAGRWSTRINANVHDALGSLPVDGDIAQVAAGPLRAALQAVAYAQADDEKRWVLNGIHCREDAGQLAVYATDGHRLAGAVVADSAALVPLLNGVTLDRNGVPALLALLDTDGQVRVGRSKTRVWVARENATAWCGLLEGQYPDVAAVIPAGGATTVKLPPADLASLARRVALVQGERTTITVDGGEVHVRSQSVERGEASDALDASVTGAAGATVGVNIGYLRDALAQLDGVESAELSINDPLAPILLRGGLHTAVVMPMRV